MVIFVTGLNPGGKQSSGKQVITSAPYSQTLSRGSGVKGYRGLESEGFRDLAA